MSMPRSARKRKAQEARAHQRAAKTRQRHDPNYKPRKQVTQRKAPTHVFDFRAELLSAESMRGILQRRIVRRWMQANRAGDEAA